MHEQQGDEALELLQEFLDGTELFQLRVTHMRLSQHANQAAVAIQNARLYEQVLASRQRLERAGDPQHKPENGTTTETPREAPLEKKPAA